MNIGQNENQPADPLALTFNYTSVDVHFLKAIQNMFIMPEEGNTNNSTIKSTVIL